jgi:APA family basic amino acid/polyamine antiporter
MTLLVMGTVIGTGIFVVPHNVAGLVHTSPLVLGAWALGGLVALAGSLSYAELVRRRPHVGGQYAFLREAYHPTVSFVYGWSLLWVIQSGGMASVAVIFARYFLELLALLQLPALDFTAAPTAQGVATSLAIGLLTLINCAGVRAASTTQNIFMTLKILAILLLVVCGLIYAESVGMGLSGSRTNTRAASATGIWQQTSDFGAALVMVFFAYGGWHTATFMAAEVNEPRRTLSCGLILGVGGVIVLYLAVNFVCLQVLGIDNLAISEHPASDVMYRAFGGPGAVLISLGIAISALGFLSQATLTSPRVYYAMACDGLFFKFIAWVHPRTQVPVVAILLQGLFAMVIAVSGTFAQILNYVMSVELLFLSLTALSLFIIRRRDASLACVAGEGKSPNGSMPGHPATTILFALVNLAVLANLFFTAPENSLIGLGIALAGLPVYFIWRTVAHGDGKEGARSSLH